MKSASAFAPANISCIFTIEKGEAPQKTGSTGVGFTINDGVCVEVCESNKTEIFFNNRKINFPTVESTIDFLTKKPVRVNIKSDLPLGCGFGLSGASALAASYSINNLLDLQKTKLDLAKIAHVAEVENGTGLGDITNQYFRGFILKTEPSFKFKVQKIHLFNTAVFCKVFSKLSTKKIISGSNFLKINKSGKEATRKVQALKNPSFAEIIKISKQFAIESGLLENQEVKDCIKEIENKGGNASMIMLGNAVFADIPFEGASKYEIE